MTRWATPTTPWPRTSTASGSSPTTTPSRRSAVRITSTGSAAPTMRSPSGSIWRPSNSSRRRMPNAFDITCKLRRRNMHRQAIEHATTGASMGTWGERAFDNDTANDWAYDLDGIEDLSLVETAFHELEEAGDDFLDQDLACNALAACEVLARLRGNFGYLDA